MENCLRTTLKTGQFLVIDQATFHKRGCISQLIEDAGCQLLYLPPYSPDLNKIEQRRGDTKRQFRILLVTLKRYWTKKHGFLVERGL